MTIITGLISTSDKCSSEGGFSYSKFKYHQKKKTTTQAVDASEVQIPQMRFAIAFQA